MEDVRPHVRTLPKRPRELVPRLQFPSLPGPSWLGVVGSPPATVFGRCVPPRSSPRLVPVEPRRFLITAITAKSCQEQKNPPPDDGLPRSALTTTESSAPGSFVTSIGPPNRADERGESLRLAHGAFLSGTGLDQVSRRWHTRRVESRPRSGHGGRPARRAIGPVDPNDQDPWTAPWPRRRAG